MPPDTPNTLPVEGFTLAIAGVLLLQVPLPAASVNDIELPAHNEVGPVTVPAPGAPFTVIIMVSDAGPHAPFTV